MKHGIGEHGARAWKASGVWGPASINSLWCNPDYGQVALDGICNVCTGKCTNTAGTNYGCPHGKWHMTECSVSQKLNVSLSGLN